jgi:Single-strand binding protein family
VSDPDPAKAVAEARDLTPDGAERVDAIREQAKALLDDELTKRSILDFANQIGLPESGIARPCSGWPSPAGGTRRRRSSPWSSGGTRPSPLSKGSRIVVVGRLRQRAWTAEDGTARSTVQVMAEELGPSLRWATATGATRSQSQ